MNKNETIKELIQKIDRDNLSLNYYIDNYKNKIQKNDQEINSFISLNDNQEKYIETVEKDFNSMPLKGIPIAVKDNIAVKDINCTCASNILSNFKPFYDATVIERLKEQGAYIIGKTNMDEFAMGSTTETSHYGITKNPVNKSYVPGGSSGGSAAAVAAGFVPAALGSDTGGSVRQPASFCGITGYKPTYSLLSRYGLVAFGSSLDQIGILSNTCEDAAFLTSLMLGKDIKDSTSSSVIPENIENFKSIDIKGKKIGLIKETISEGSDADVIDVINKYVDKMKELGADVEVFSMPELDYAVSIYYIIAPAEASSNLARYDGIRYGLQLDKDEKRDVKTLFTQTRSMGFGEEVKRRIIIGNFVLSSGYYDAYYKKAQKARILLSDAFKKAFQKYDLITTPTSPMLPFKIGETKDDPLKAYTADLCTIPVNLAGLPAVSIPAGDVNGLPVGIQLIAPRFADGFMLGIGDFLERSVK